MIHTKSLIRRLAYVPWLLAFGLVLGWAGEAQAQKIELSVDKTVVREDGGAVTIKVTAKTKDANGDHVALGDNERVVILTQSSTPADQFGKRFTITLPTIVIAKDAKEVSVDAVLTPISTTDDNRDITIQIAGNAGGTTVDDPAAITILDTHKQSTKITLSLSPAKISKEAERTAVTVTASLNGKTVNNKALSFLVRQQAGGTATRDADYDITSGSLTIARKKSSGSTTIYVEPKNAKAGTIKIGTADKIEISGKDVNNDLDAEDSWQAYGDTETAVGASIVIKRQDSITDSFTVAPTLIDHDGDRNNDNVYRYLESAIDTDADGNADGFDLNNNNDTADTLAVVSEKDLLQTLEIDAVDFTIAEDAIAATKGLTATPSVLRESLVGQTEDSREESVALKVELEHALTEDANVRFLVRDDLDDLAEDFTDDGTVVAERGTHYEATVDALVIPAGETTGTTTLNLTLFDDGGKNPTRAFRVQAQVGTVVKYVGIKITDDETPTTNIALSASPGEIKADSGEQTIAITGTVNGDAFEEDQTITLVIVGGDAAATRDTEYTAVLRSLTIPAGQIEGSTTVSVTALAGGDKKVWIGSVKNDPFTKNIEDDDVNVSAVAVVLKDADPVDEAVDPGALGFGVDLSSTVYDGMVGSALAVIELPEATGGEGDRTYSISANLPAGLSFDPDTRTISGTPTTVGTEVVTYAVVDSKGSAATTLTIEIAAAAPPTVEVAEVSASQTSVRENGATTEISVKATLSSPAPIAETIRFTIEAPSVGAAAVRDVDYTASIGGSVAVEAGATQASTTLTLTPIDNGQEDGNRALAVVAAASGGSASADVTIADDETASTSISLSAEPHTVSESAGVTNVTITATLNGRVLDAAAIVTLSVDPGSEATRDVDYSALFNPLLTIPAGAVSGSTELLIDPTADGADEGNETITLLGAIAGLADGSGTITLNDHEAPPPVEPLAFAGEAGDFATTAGEALASVELPAASGGSGDVAYSVSELPAGLSFDAATRTISGTPEADGVTEVTYTATDSAGDTVTLTFSITVNPPPIFDFDNSDLSDLFGAFTGAGKANPADEHDDGVLQLVVGQAFDLALPAVSGGTPPLSYSVSGLPAGLSFDPATRTISGTPSEVSDAAAVIYTVTDASGASSSLPFLVAVIEPPLDAPDALVAEDYKGADGAGDQGGFVLLTWDLSDHHDDIDGYRIFRELPVLDNEMVPWAMVDAVPGVDRGVAIVATLDNVATNWGIAAERGGQTTHGAAKAVFAGADTPYALMAETMAASRAAAQASAGPVLAALLPEALAYAQGVAPKLNIVGGVLSSAVTITDEPVRAIDDIAPLAVPSLSALDAPNDAGSRIALTWALSPSDQLLQGVVAEVVGPTAAEPVFGVHGYGIYRRAAGEDEFALVGQVEAGVASFVDETALNGVHYTYQVRAYDLDNETVSVEQTALAVRNLAEDSDGRAIFGLFGADNHIGFDDFFLFADNFGLTAEDAGFDPAFDLAPSAMIDFDDFFVFADNFGRSTAAAGKRVPMFAGLNADARLYLDAQTVLPNVGEDFVLDVRLADFAALKGYGLQVQYEADKLSFVEVLTDQPLGSSELATPQVLADQAGVLTVAAHGDMVSDGEVALSLVFRPTAEIENTVVEITDNQTYDSALGFNRLALPAPVALQTRPEVFALANNYPNPFNPATTIKYALPQAADVALTVYNVLGQPVRTLVAEHQNAGRYVVEWDATNDSGHSLSSGMYFYRLQAGGEFLEVKKMLLLK